jgi:membrane protease YdiL (CAAX protease family)
LEIVATILPMLVLGLLFTLAHVADRQTDPGLRTVVVVLLALLDLFALLLGGLLLAAGLASALIGAEITGGEVELPESALEADQMAPLLDAMVALGPIMIGLAVLALLVLVPPVRRALARLLPIDPARATHTVALQCALLAFGMSAATALLLPAILADPAGLETIAAGVASGGLAPLWAQNVGFVLLALLGVGLGVRGGGVLERLGLTARIDWRWWLGATLASLASAVATDWVWGIVSPESLAEVDRISEALFGPFVEYGLLGALTIGLAAGIGEEILFRGAAQPRLGLPLTALLFSAIHTQYTVSPALVHIFVIGMLLGLVRKRVNTTTAIAVHASYNFLLALSSVLEAGVPLLPGG